MCEFCIQHGDGKKWYLQAKHYAEELLTEEVKAFVEPFFAQYGHLIRKQQSGNQHPHNQTFRNACLLLACACIYFPVYARVFTFSQPANQVR